MVADSNAHVLAAIKTGFRATVAGEDVELLQDLNNNFTGSEGLYDLTKEIVGLRGHDTEERHTTKLTLEIGTLGNKTGAGFLVVALVFGVDLHKELGEGVEIPDGHALFHLGDEGLIC